MNTAPVSILHLSDIHAGVGELVDEDGKQSIPQAERHKQLTRLSGYIENLPTKPDFVVVSGDITIKGQDDGLETFRSWLFEHIGRGHLPSPSRIIITPGNHDVTRRLRTEDSDKKRFANFWDTFGLNFPHAHIPDLDPPLDTSGHTFTPDSDGLMGGLTLTEKNGRRVLEQSHPFVFDTQRGVVIFAFNSAHACGVPLTPDPKVLRPLDALIQLHHSDSESVELKNIREAYLDSLIIDAGLITDFQLSYFGRVISKLRNAYGVTFDSSTKLAVLHHHIGHLWRQQLELKTFEATVDAAQLKQALIETGFDIVLHGHKHTNHVGMEGGLIPISDNTRFNPLCVISGGTIGGNPRLNDRQTFKILQLPGGKRPRTQMVVLEIPIRYTADASAAIRADAKIYNAPLSQGLPRLHKLSALKTAVDNYVLAQCSSEFETARVDANDTSTAPTTHLLFSSSLRYRCHTLIDDGQIKRYYDVILATRKIGFKTISRLHWLVTQVLDGPSTDKRVIIVIGNLEDTHFSEAQSVGEVTDSINNLKELFKPALDSHLVEIREYVMKQSELEQITRANDSFSNSREPI